MQERKTLRLGLALLLAMAALSLGAISSTRVSAAWTLPPSATRWTC